MTYTKEAIENMHFFGEMDLDLTESKKKILKEANRIAECCGYFVTHSEETENESERIIMTGEDCSDSLIVENVINFFSGKLSTLQKVVYRIEDSEKEDKTMIQVFNYMLNDKAEYEWIEIFNLKKHEENLRNSKQYQEALKREGKTDHKLFNPTILEK